jgi:ABC-type molybdate transport system permease subunit
VVDKKLWTSVVQLPLILHPSFSGLISHQIFGYIFAHTLKAGLKDWWVPPFVKNVLL